MRIDQIIRVLTLDVFLPASFLLGIYLIAEWKKQKKDWMFFTGLLLPIIAFGIFLYVFNRY